MEKFGNYEILRKIASGGMAEVFLAKQTSLGGFERLVCIKRILPHLGEQDDFITMFMDEARIAANLVHPNIAQIYDIGEVDGAYFIAMEYVRGEDLRRIYNQEVQRGRPIQPEQAAQIVMYGGAGLDYAHRQTTIDGRPLGLVHRDVSPQNILVNYDGHVKVVDFGVAKAANKMNETRSGVLKGKYSYMSPEQASGDPIDARTDIFALGITLYEVTTGTRLFKRENELETLHAVIACEIKAPSDVIPGYDQDLEAIILRALAYDPDDRYPSAGELERDLERFLVARNHPVGPSSLASYMQDLFAEKLADELLFGGPPFEEENTSSRAPGGTRKLDKSGSRKKKKRRGSAEAEAEAEDDEDTDISRPGDTEISRPSASGTSEETVIDDLWASGSRSDSRSRSKSKSRSKKKRRRKSSRSGSRTDPRKHDDWGMESASASQTATQGAGDAAFADVQSNSRSSPRVVVKRVEPRRGGPIERGSRWMTTIAIASLVAGLAVGVTLVATSERGKQFDGPMSGALTIDSEPRGARVVFLGPGAVTLNAKYEGHRTPFTVAEGLRVDVPVRFRLLKEGYDITEAELPKLAEGVVPRPLFVELTPNAEGSEEGSLILLSNPVGAEVWIDGEKKEGKTPLNDVRVEGGTTHKVEFHLTGYQPRWETIYVEPGSRRFIEMNLMPASSPAPGPAGPVAASAKPIAVGPAPSPPSPAPEAKPVAPAPAPAPAPARFNPTPTAGVSPPRQNGNPAKGRKAFLSVQAPMKLRVTVGKKFVGETPIKKLALEPGVHRLKLESLSEGFIVRRKVRLNPGRSETIDLRPRKGNLALNATPWAWVRVGKGSPAETPVRLSVFEGEYNVQFECPDGRRMREQVRVMPNQTASASVNCRN